MNKHIADLTASHPQLTVCAGDIQSAFEILRDCFAAGGKLLLCGNGGSAADCEHISGELLKGFVSRRPLGEAERAALGEPLAAKLQGALPAIPLTGFSAFSTAFGNDVDPEYCFAQLVWALGRPGDTLLGITTSGNSANVLHAASAARARGMAVLGLTGSGGGKLAGLAGVTIRVPETTVHLVQQLHLPVYHALCLMLEEEFFGVQSQA
ncbi:SIS domain-containing protein [bacterium]|nr:SIS domain-containing protein [bacterium]